MSEYIVRMPPDMPYEIRAELNAWYVESEPIVRCRDCTWFHWDDSGRWCAQSLVRRSEHDGFCAWGTRKEVNNDNQ